MKDTTLQLTTALLRILKTADLDNEQRQAALKAALAVLKGDACSLTVLTPEGSKKVEFKDNTQDY
jgi:hypothetical protein